VQTRLDEMGVAAGRTPDKALYIFKKCEQLGGWPPFFDRRRAEPGSLPESFKDVALHLQVAGDVAARGGYRCVAKIIADHGNIHTRLQKCDRTAVPHDMWRETTFRQGRSRVGCQPGVLGQQVGDTIARLAPSQQPVNQSGQLPRSGEHRNVSAQPLGQLAIVRSQGGLAVAQGERRHAQSRCHAGARAVPLPLPQWLPPLVGTCGAKVTWKMNCFSVGALCENLEKRAFYAGF
jgi:hypothetical protein